MFRPPYRKHKRLSNLIIMSVIVFGQVSLTVFSYYLGHGDGYADGRLFVSQTIDQIVNSLTDDPLVRRVAHDCIYDRYREIVK